MNDMRLTERAVDTKTKISARQVQVFYDDTHAIKDVDVDILDNTVTAFIEVSDSRIGAYDSISPPVVKRYSALHGRGPIRMACLCSAQRISN